MTGYVTVQEFRTPSRADFYLSVLREKGIAAILQDDNVVSWFPHYALGFHGMKLCVPEEDREEALSILAETLPSDTWMCSSDVSGENEEAPESQVPAADATMLFPGLCPNCGSEDVTEFREPELLRWLAFTVGLLLLAPLWREPTTRRRMVCEDCQADWLE